MLIDGRYDTLHRHAQSLRSGLDASRPRWVCISPPCGTDPLMQSLNQKPGEQCSELDEKCSRAHRIQKSVRDTVLWLQGTPWCEEVVLEQSASCRSMYKRGNFSDIKHQFHGALVPGCHWGLKSGGCISSKSWYLVTKTRRTADVTVGGA